MQRGLACVSGGPDGDGYGSGCGVRGSQHVATPVENPAGINHHAGRVYFSSDDTFRLNLDAALGENHTIEAAGNHHAIPFDLPFDFSAVAENDGLLRNDVALHVAVNAERAADGERPFEGHALINKACPLFTV